MKLLHFSSKFFRLLQQNHRPIGILSSHFSSKTLTPPSSSNSLYHRIQLIRDPKVSVVPLLEQWINEGRPVIKRQIQYLVRTMKDYKRYQHALEISQWMTDRRYLGLSSSDVALRLDLIHRVHGIEKAEDYFNKVSDKLKVYNVYGALLNAYVQEKFVEKAEILVQKMREMGFVTSSFPYNMMINLYTHTGDLNKIKMLVQEMDKKGIPQDKYTVRNLMASYIAVSDIAGMEKVLNRAKDDAQIVIDWKMYSLAAGGYTKVGLMEKALEMLKEMEKLMPLQNTNLALEFLITLYANTGDKDELYRVWNTYKLQLNHERNGAYSCMIISLAKLNDIDGAEKIFEEWESRCTMYDFRVLNRLLVAYCKKGLLEKAESAVNKAVEGRTPYASTWNILAIGFKEHNQMAKAVEMVKKAITIGRRGWQLNPDTCCSCLDYLEGQGDVRGVEDFIKSLKKLGPLTKEIYHRWLRNCIAAGKSVYEVLDEMKMDGISADEETQKILESILSV